MQVPKPLAAMLLSLAGCTSALMEPQGGVEQDVEFVRGCWVMKDEDNGATIAYLRLLPVGANGSEYGGQISLVDSFLGVDRGSSFIFARDGSSIKLRIDAEGPHITLPKGELGELPVEPAGARAVYGGPRPDDTRAKFVVAEGDGNHLSIFFSGNIGAPLIGLFQGERDGCD